MASNISLRNLSDKQQQALKGLLYWRWELAMYKYLPAEKEYYNQILSNIQYNKEQCDKAEVPPIYKKLVLDNTTSQTDCTRLSDVIPY